MRVMDEPVEKAVTVGEYANDERQTIRIKYEGTDCLYELWQAVPSCKHEIQSRRSGGVRCLKCGGWCAF